MYSYVQWNGGIFSKIQPSHQALIHILTIYHVSTNLPAKPKEKRKFLKKKSKNLNLQKIKTWPKGKLYVPEASKLFGERNCEI